jgi:hypothetical protein
MKRSIGLWRPVAVALAMSLFATTSPAGSSRQEEDDVERTAALQTFTERVTAYAALHRHLAASLPVKGLRMDRQSLLAARTALAGAIRNARPNARQGDFFSPVVTNIVRDIIGRAAADGAFWTFTPPMDEEGRLLPGLHPRVYDPFPGWETQDIPATVVNTLPTLPSELEYRLVEYDLVLWDICADLIVDVLPYAVAHPMSEFIYR